MYSVYFEDKVICFTADPAHSGDPGAVLTLRPGGNGIAKVLEKLENNKQVYIKSDDPANDFAGFFSGFARAEAAGGLVVNGGGDSLMIFREGRWDLPKGHVDEGEGYEECAAREVREECGLQAVEVGRFLCETYHIYNRYGGWTIKETKWYGMRSDDRELVPQREEGIEKAEWVPTGEIGERLAAGYPTIREVFSAYATKKGRL